MPVNFLIPFEGTPLAEKWNLTPQRCLRILAMVRFVCPDVEVRLAGGREVHLRTLQPLALHLVNSIFLGDYLTSEGQAGKADLDMIADAGFEVEGTEHDHAARAPGGGGRRLRVDEAAAAAPRRSAGAAVRHERLRVRLARGGGVCGSVRRGDRRPAAAGRGAAGRGPHRPGRRAPPRRGHRSRAQCLSRPARGAAELLALDRRHVWHPYGPMPGRADPLVVESASGVRLRLADGAGELIDGMSSWWSAIHGYDHPVLDDAVREQLGRMSHVMFGGLTHEPAVRLASRWSSITAGRARARVPLRLRARWRSRSRSRCACSTGARWAGRPSSGC